LTVRHDGLRQTCHGVHRIPLPTFVTIAKRPSDRQQDGDYIRLIFVSEKQNIFAGRAGLVGQIRCNARGILTDGLTFAFGGIADMS